MKRLMVFCTAAVAAWWLWSDSSGTIATVLPEGGLAYSGYTIEPLEEFAIEARVLSRQNYGNDREANLAPTDLALGWGPMADDAVLDEIEISQRNRWYFWRASQLPIPARDVAHHSANVHIIPASTDAADALARVDIHDRVRLAGKLVEVRAEDGWRWRSSLSRTDSGRGSCELLWLERLDVL